MTDMPLVARAFALARDGSCRTVADIRRRLVSEGYAQVSEYTAGKTIVRQLQSAIEAARS